MKILIFVLLSSSFIFGQIWQPLHVGNKYQTWGVYYGNLGYYSAFCTDYSLTKNTFIHGIEYFYYDQLPEGLNNTPTRYDTLEKRFYYVKNDTEYSSFDFNHLDGDTFSSRFPYDNSIPCLFFAGTKTLGGKDVEFEGIRTYHFTPMPYSYYTFYKNMGIINTSWGGLIGAKMVSGKDTLIFDTGYAPYFTNTTLPDTITTMFFNPTLEIRHYYTWFPIQGEPGSSVDYISSTWMAGYYFNGTDSVNAGTFAISGRNRSLFSFNCKLDTTYLKHGYDFYYNIYATDRAVIPHTSELEHHWLKVVYIDAATSIRDRYSIKGFKLSQNYPNPFNPATTITYSIPQNGVVRIRVFDIMGNEIKQLVNEYKEAGIHELNFDASNLASGVYFYRLESGAYSAIKKMILLR